MKQKSTFYKIWHFPLTRIVIGFLLCGIVASLGQNLVKQLFSNSNLNAKYINLIAGIIASSLIILVYYFLYKFYEKRNIAELSAKKIGHYLIFGILLGVVLQSLTILLIFLFGDYTIISINPLSSLLLPFIMAFTSAIIEEILFRGIIFRIIEEKLGSYIALLISALIFGAMHLANPNSSILSAISIAIQAGLLLGVAYIYTKNLWFPIAIHFAWNFTQSAIYGATVSGIETKHSLFTSKISGIDLITGGNFGPEASLQATLFCLIATLILHLLSKKKGQIITPYWVNKHNKMNINNIS